MKVLWRRRPLRWLSILLLVAVGWPLGLKLAPPPDPYAVYPAGVRVLDRDGRLVRGFLSSDDKRRWRLQLDEISPELVQAVLFHEDRWFYRHPGVNPVAVARAAWGNLRAGRITSGASTLSMQLARLAEPRRRTLGAKIHQMVRALQYESLYSKDEILTMYLNLAPYGGNVEGVAAAAQILFDKSAAELSWAEACQLAVLPQSPSRHDPVLNPESARLARDRLATRMAEAGVLDAVKLDEVFTSPLPFRRHSSPFMAPHFSRWSKGRHPGLTTLHTTLDLNLQNRVAKALTGRVRQLRPLGIEQAAAVILDATTGEVRAMVGSAGFSEEVFQGQVNGAIAPRSPGSALKPFVYALAFDRGLKTPDTLVEDVPRWFADYNPKNFDGTFSGAVRCGTALQQSLNVPAVSLAAELEQGSAGGLLPFLKDAGVQSLDQPTGHYGLTLVLGGGEVTLLELASLYGVLARQGVWLPTRDLLPDGQTPNPGRRLLGAGAAWLTMQELTGVHRPEPERLWQSRSGHQQIPWKTGTSYGHRDAWSVGVVGDMVVAVWVGNFDGKGSPHLTGGEVAAPLFFSLVELLDNDQQPSWNRRPDGISQREICPLSGAPITKNCGTGRKGFFLPGVSPTAPCEIHRLIQIDALDGHTVCSRCRGDRALDTLTVEWWPPQVLSYLSGGGLARPAVPAHNSQCPVFGAGEAPVFKSPQDGSEFHLRRGIPLNDQAISLEAAVSAGTRRLWWFANGALIGETGPSEPLFHLPVAGFTRLTMVDDAGRSGSVRIRVIDDSQPLVP